MMEPLLVGDPHQVVMAAVAVIIAARGLSRVSS